MKQKLTLILIFTICLTVYGVQSEDKFINALSNCSSYHESGNVNVQGINVTSEKQIYGWRNNKCTYKENINMGGINTNIVCGFTKSQIHEIGSVADAYALTLKYSGANAEIPSLDNVENNPIANVFNKYLRDPSVCTINSMQ